MRWVASTGSGFLERLVLAQLVPTQLADSHGCSCPAPPAAATATALLLFATLAGEAFLVAAHGA